MIHLVNTDPPYNVRVEPRSNNAIAAGLSTFAAYGNSDPGRDVVRFPEKAKPTGKKMRAKDRPLEHQAQFDRNSQVFRACVAAAGLSISWPLISPMSFVAGPAVVGAPRLVLKPVEQDAVATTWKQAESYGDQTLHSGWT
jgi:hypothetical protein